MSRQICFLNTLIILRLPFSRRQTTRDFAHHSYTHFTFRFCDLDHDQMIMMYTLDNYSYNYNK